jgi:hypothetical protein
LNGLADHVRQWLRRRRAWVRLRELGREGIGRAMVRRRYQRRILATAPIQTDITGPVEVRALTWRRDWIDLIWALKSFYYFSGVDWPLHIHDGGLSGPELAVLQEHFRGARIHAAAEADAVVESLLQQRGLARSVEYRRRNISTRKLWDFFLLSRAQRIITIDSDVLFFGRPTELIDTPAGRLNRYNRDLNSAYAATPQELESAFGIRVPPEVNSGLASIWCESIDFAAIDQWLKHPRLFENRWVTEQTLHALCSARFGMELLPEMYVVSVQPGLAPGTISKHYVTAPRPLLYSEGMARLIDEGFLERLGKRNRA